MASQQLDDTNPQARALRQCTRELMKAICTADLLDVVWQLFEKELIELDIVDYCELQVTPSQKSSKIVSSLIKTVSASPQLFESLVSVLTESGNTSLKLVGEKLNELLQKQLIEAQSLHTQPHQLPPQQQSPAIHQYADYLKAVYTSKLFNSGCYKWTCSPVRKFKFINLAVISKKEINKKEEDDIRKNAVHGKIDEILKERKPIALENILKAEEGEPLTCVLIEGAPGTGKSTLIWELCKCWGRGELFQEYSIVLLLILRDERVQRATSAVDLFYHSDTKLREEVVRNIGKNNGKGTLIILEGLDELPRHLLIRHSIFTDLPSGKIFPKATVLVTSRPSATDNLWWRRWQGISRHIQILGFTENNINEYSKSVLSELQLLEFNHYLSIHPHIKSMMYVPLHCVIAIAVYLECQQSDQPPPKTLTGLYTCLAQIILVQYLQDHPEYKGSHVHLSSFSDLPSPIYALFKRLCALAFDGVDKQKLVFRSLPQSQSPDSPQQFDPLGFMDAIPELSLLSQQPASFSYNFLHLSIQEYLAAYHVAQLSTSEQEQLLRKVKYGDHYSNMIQFLAGITQFKHLNKELVEDVIGMRKSSQVELRNYTLELLYECQDVSILNSEHSYHSSIDSTTSVHCLTALGYNIAKSSSIWHLKFSGRKETDYRVLWHSLKENSHPTYHIESLVCRNCASGFTCQVLKHLPQVDLKNISISNGEPIPGQSLTVNLDAGTIESRDCMTEFLDQSLPVLSQKKIEGIKSFNIMISYATRAKPLPFCTLELIPKMKNLSSITFMTVLDATLIEIIPILSTIPAFRKLILHVTLSDFEVGTFTYGTLENVCTCRCISSEVIDQLLQFFPQQYMAKIQTLQVSCNQSKPLPSCLPELVLRMEMLSTLTLKNVLDISLTELLPALSKVPSLRNLSLPKLNAENITFLCQWLLTCQLEKLMFCDKVEDLATNKMTMFFCNNSIDTIEYEYYTNDVLPQILMQELIITQIKTLTIWNKLHHHQSLPPSLPELIPKMDNLKTLTLKNVLDTSLTELIPALPKVHTLRNILISDSNRIHYFEMQFPSEDLSTGTIESVNYTSEFLDQLLPALPQQSITGIKSLAITGSVQPLPSCILELVPKMENLNSITFMTVINATLRALIPLLSTIPMKSLSMKFVKSVHHFHAERFIYDTLENVCTCTCSSPEIIDQLLQFLPQWHMEQIQTFHVNYSKPNELPTCFPKLISRMKRLNTLTLKNVFDTLLTELMTVLSTVQNLRKLALPKLTSESIVLLCQWLPTCKLETLKLPFLSSHNIEMVSRALTKFSSLNTLDVQRSKFTLQDMQAFAPMLQQKHSLTELVISSCSIDGDSAGCLADHCPSTAPRKLNMSENPVGERGALAMAEMIKRNTTLEELDLSNAKINSDGAVAMAKALYDNTALRKLDMSRNPVGERGALAIAEMLKQNTILERLNLNNTKISSDGVVAMAKALYHNTALRMLDMRQNSIGESARGALAMAELLKHTTTLEELNVSSANIDSGGVATIARALTHNTTLRRIDMSGNQVGKMGALAIAKLLKQNTSLEELNVSKADICSDETVTIAEALHHNTKLRILDMRGNPVGDRGALSMAEMLKRNSTLEELSITETVCATLSRDKITDKGIKELVESLAVNQHLTKLIISSTYREFITSSLPLYSAHKERVVFGF